VTKQGAVATKLDEEMLRANIQSAGWPGPLPPIAPSSTSDAQLEQDYQKSGSQVAAETGGRLLLKYLRRPEIGTYSAAGGVFTNLHYVTVTPYQLADLNTFLALPLPHEPREHVLLIDSRAIDEIWGPRWIRFGLGIEYLLPSGFRSDDIAVPSLGGGFKWELEID
jgi:hypothetical protein